jgi:peroxiredoxin
LPFAGRNGRQVTHLPLEITVMSLADRLEQAKREWRSRLTPELADALEALVKHLETSQITAASLKADDPMPDFELPNSDGRVISSRELLKRGPLVVSYFRGDWCPYCVLELRALEEALPRIEELGATLVAITPDTGAALASTKHINRFSYQVLGDADNGVALRLGLVFRLPEAIQKPLLEMGIDLPKRHGNDAWFLPIPATYVVDRGGIIRHAELDPDYTRRMEPQAIIGLLEAIARESGSLDDALAR